MADILKKICDDKREYVATCKSKISYADIRKQAENAGKTRGFADSLKRFVEKSRYGLIAEIKKASPSAGLIRHDFNPSELAKAYENGGAACLSILTDTPYFQGSDEFLKEARGAVSIPVLRKDFMVDIYQIAESRAIGADCILLIMAALEDNQAKEFESAAFSYGMDVLVEVHNEQELERALLLETPLLGINNRNLKTLVTDVSTTEKLAKLVPENKYIVAESGLNTQEDLARMSKAGANRFLIGESLMKKHDLKKATKEILAI